MNSELMNLLNVDEIAVALYNRLDVYTPLHFALNSYNYPIDVFIGYLQKALQEVLDVRVPDDIVYCSGVLDREFESYRNYVGALSDADYKAQQARLDGDLQAFRRVMCCFDRRKNGLP